MGFLWTGVIPLPGGQGCSTWADSLITNPSLPVKNPLRSSHAYLIEHLVWWSAKESHESKNTTLIRGKMFFMVLEPQMLFRGLFGTFVSLVGFSSIFPATTWWMSSKSHVNKRDFGRVGDCKKTSAQTLLGEPFRLPDEFFSPVLEHGAEQGASRAPWSLLHLLPFRGGLCCSIGSDTASIGGVPGTRRGLRGVPRPRTSPSDADRVFSSGCFFFFFVLWQWTVAPSQAWNHLSSALKGLHGFLMMSPYLLYGKYMQWLHSFLMHI